MRKIFPVALTLLATVACDDSPTAPTGDPTTPAATFTQVQTRVFNASCVMHHGATALAGLDLRSPQSHGNLVNVPSSQGLPLVAPGNPDGQLPGAQARGRATIAGARMPAGGAPPLGDDLIQLVRDWIQAGAPNN